MGQVCTGGVEVKRCSLLAVGVGESSLGVRGSVFSRRAWVWRNTCSSRQPHAEA